MAANCRWPRLVVAVARRAADEDGLTVYLAESDLAYPEGRDPVPLVSRVR